MLMVLQTGDQPCFRDLLLDDFNVIELPVVGMNFLDEMSKHELSGFLYWISIYVVLCNFGDGEVLSNSTQCVQLPSEAWAAWNASTTTCYAHSLKSKHLFISYYIFPVLEQENEAFSHFDPNLNYSPKEAPPVSSSKKHVLDIFACKPSVNTAHLQS